MEKSVATKASFKLTQMIFYGSIALFVSILCLTVINYVTGGAVLNYLSRFDKQGVLEENLKEDVRIATVAPFTTLRPLNFEFQNRLVMNNVYEGLVALDPSLQPKQALAVTFGQLDDLTWEFRLREGVTFHNGALMSASDVIKSFRTAMNDPQSQLTSFLSNIESIDANSGRVIITTKKPDPTFLNKLATVYIYKDYGGDEIYGTGPYKFQKKSTDSVLLERYENYWGNEPKYENGQYVYLKDRDSRLSLFKDGGIDIYRNVPSQQIAALESLGATMIFQPSLEVTFLGYGYENTTLFNNSDLASLLYSIVDKEALASRFGESVIPIDQFVSNGVVGNIPDLETFTLSNKDRAEIISKVKEAQVEEGALVLSFSMGLTPVAEELKSQLEEYGIVIELNPLNDIELLKLLTDGTADMYLLGWKSEFGDAINFYKVLTHTKKDDLGAFNAGSYSSSEVDTFIGISDNTFSTLERIKILQRIMETLLFDKPFGLPLFETQIVYAVSDSIEFIPRIDGYVYLNEIR